MAYHIEPFELREAEEIVHPKEEWFLLGAIGDLLCIFAIVIYLAETILHFRYPFHQWLLNIFLLGYAFDFIFRVKNRNRIFFFYKFKGK